MTHAIAHAAPSRSVSQRRGLLALAFQETLTAIVRLRSSRQVAANADAFRSHLKQALEGAKSEASRAGYPEADIRDATSAVVAFLDDTVVTSATPLAADWSRRPLHAELLGEDGAAAFSRQLDALLARTDSDELADVLEVYALTLSLGYTAGQGRDAASALAGRVHRRIDGIRGDAVVFSDSWVPSGSELASSGGSSRGLMVATIGLVVLAIALFAGFWFTLRSAGADLRATATAGTPR